MKWRCQTLCHDHWMVDGGCVNPESNEGVVQRMFLLLTGLMRKPWFCRDSSNAH